MSPDPTKFTYPISTDHIPANAAKTVLITGINGFIASHIAYLLLQKGYTVRGTSRSPTTPQRLLSQPAFTPFATTNCLEHVVVKDITAPNAFDDAVKGVHAVLHTASPVDFSLKSVDAFFEPAIGGVKQILGSVREENAKGGKVEKFILLSSIAAIVDRWRYPATRDGGTENRAYDERDWNVSGEGVARASEGEGKTFLPMVAYGASKAASERAMWEEIEKTNGTEGCAICPGVVTGPPVNWPERPEGLNETLMPVWKVWSGDCKRKGRLTPQIGGSTYIDVRDVAALHVWAVENAESSGQRYLATNGKAPPQGIADLLRDNGELGIGLFRGSDKGNVKVRERIILGEPGADYVEAFGWPSDEPTCKATKAYQALGIEKFRGYEESIKDTVDSFRLQWPELSL